MAVRLHPDVSRQGRSPMSLAFLAVAPETGLPWMTAPTPSPKRGSRYPADLYRVTRKRHIRAAYYHLIEGETLARVARRFNVSIATIHNWVKRVEHYHDPEAIALRRLLDR